MVRMGWGGGGREGGPMKGFETDDVISGPMRGLKIVLMERGHTTYIKH